MFRTALVLLLAISCRGSAPFGSIDDGDRPGSDLVGSPVKTTSGVLCSAACWSNTKCKSWAFDTCGSGSCWLKTTKSQVVPASCRQSGVITARRKHIKGRYGSYTLGDMPGNDLPGGISQTNSVTDCQTRCASTLGCTFWAFRFCDNTCFLKTGKPTPFGANQCTLSGVINGSAPNPQPIPTPPPSNPVLKANDPLINWVGRYQIDGTNARMDWPGVQMRVRVTATPFLDVSMDSSGSYEILVNGQRRSTVTMNRGASTRVVADLDSNQYNDVVLYRNNEPSIPDNSIATLYQIQGADGASFVQYTPKARKLEFIGDSITCGYGIFGDNANCHGNGPNGVLESAYANYVRLIADQLNADANRVSWSGRGMVYNCCGDRQSPVMPQLYRYTLGNDWNIGWDFNRWRPDAIVVNLGTNDFFGNPAPPLDFFTDGYVNFVNFLHNTYPGIPIFSICGGIIEGDFCNAIATAASRTGATYINLPYLTDTQKGCDGHPNVEGHQVAASIIAPVIARQLNW